MKPNNREALVSDDQVRSIKKAMMPIINDQNTRVEKLQKKEKYASDHEITERAIISYRSKNFSFLCDVKLPVGLLTEFQIESILSDQIRFTNK